MRTTPLDTPRLLFRKMTLEDLDFVAEMLADKEVMRFYPKCYLRDQAREWLQRMLDRYEQDGHALWLVLHRESNQPLGQIGLILQRVDGVKEAEIGYLVHRPYWGHGYATEGAAAVRDYAFGTLEKRRVISLIRPVNIPSQRVALRIGLKPEKLVDHANLKHLVFSLHREEFEG